jgi:putative membrane protein
MPSEKEVTVMLWWSQHGDGWAFALMSISMLLFWGLVILGIAAVVRHLAVARRQTADEVLAERLARGEIDEPEYRSRKAALRGDPQEASGVSGAELFPDVPEGSQ